ncbi:MAG: YkgJ family cysteine cluster protein [Chitinophagales bacterium]
MFPAQLHSSQKLKFKNLFRLLKKRRSTQDDVLFAKTHEIVFAKTNCLNCANCCKTHSPLFTQKDIESISVHLKMKPSEFVSKYLLLDEEGDWIFHSTPCPFLLPDNACSIYTHRPQACKEYPHTNRKKMYQVETITLKNAGICPAVQEILTVITQKLNVR